LAREDLPGVLREAASLGRKRTQQGAFRGRNRTQQRNASDRASGSAGVG